jgi:hypothetical protein
VHPCLPSRRSLHHEIAAFDIERCAGDIAGLLGGEEADQVRDFERLAEALDRKAAGIGREVVGRGMFPRQLGIDQPRADGIDRNPIRPKLLGRGAGQIAADSVTGSSMCQTSDGMNSWNSRGWTKTSRCRVPNFSAICRA